MFNKTLTSLIILLFFAVNVIIASETSYNEFIVDNEGDGDFTTIQEAIDNASEGDFIWVYSGNYSGDIIINKTLNIIGIDQEYLNGNDTGNPHIWGAGTYIDQTSGVLFSNFSLGGIPDIDKIKLEYSNNCFILNCSADYLFLYNCSGITVKNCEFITRTNSFAAINLLLSSNNTISDNICVSEAVNTIYNTGICLQASNNNQLLNNTCTAKDSIYDKGIDIAIYISSSDNNIVNGNTCLQSDIGLKLESSNKNEITRNNLLNNTRNAFFRKSKNNIWNENYWDDLKSPSFKIIFGTIGPFFGLIPWLNFDLHPAAEPYNLTLKCIE